MKDEEGCEGAELKQKTTHRGSGNKTTHRGSGTTNHSQRFGKYWRRWLEEEEEG